MITGGGLLARAFGPRYRTDDATLVFASGVSDSAEMRQAAFEREAAALDEACAWDGGKLVYFSCCELNSTRSPATPYMRHKAAMEARVLDRRDGRVLRLPQVVGSSGNPATLCNFLHRHVRDGIPFEMWSNAQRNLLDIEHLVRIGVQMIDGGHGDAVSTIASRQTLAMPALVALFEELTGRTAVCTPLQRGHPLALGAPDAWPIADKLGIELGGDYARGVIHRYYGPAVRASRGVGFHTAATIDVPRG